MGKTDKTEKANKKQKHFWKDFKAELKKVIWPTSSQVAKNTIVVLVIVLIVTAIVFVLDLAFEALNTYGIDKLKASVQNSVVSNTDDTDTNNEANTNIDSNTSTEENAETGNSSEEQNNENEPTPDDTANVENAAE